MTMMMTMTMINQYFNECSFRSDRHGDDCRQLHRLRRRLDHAGLSYLLNWGGCWNLVFSLWSLILDLWFWSRWSQGVTLGVFSIMYLILVILMTRSFLNEVYLIIISYVVLASFFGIEVGDLLDHHGLIIVRFGLRNWERQQCQSQSRANTPLTVEYELWKVSFNTP